MVEDALSRIGSASAVGKIVPLESRDEVCRLKPVMRNECLCNGLIVKSSIFLKWPIPSMSLATYLNETPCPSQPSWTTAVKEQQCWEYGRKVTSVSVGKKSLDDLLRLL